MGLAHGGRVIAEDYFALINTKIKEIESRLGTVSGDISGKNSDLDTRFREFTARIDNSIRAIERKVDNDITTRLKSMDSTIASNYETLNTAINNKSTNLGGRIDALNTTHANDIKALRDTIDRYKTDLSGTIDTNKGIADRNHTEVTKKINDFIDKFQFGGTQPTNQNVLVWFDYKNPDDPVIRFRKGNEFVVFGTDWK